MADISNSEDILNSSDVIERIEELEDERDALAEVIEEAQEAFDATQSTIKDMEEGEDDSPEQERLAQYLEELSAARAALTDWDQSDEAEELKSLKAFAADLKGCGDWEHGATLIREDCWTEYVQEILSDIGAIPRDFPNYIVIDWQATANNVQVDYTESQLDGVTYFMRT